MTSEYKLYIDRPNTGDTIDGYLTFVTPYITYKRLPIRIGQIGYGGTNWVWARSPIPLLQDVISKKLFLHLQHVVKNGETHPLSNKPSGIGWFWPISDSKDQVRQIRGRDGQRGGIGLHAENKVKGSAGCPVVVWDTPEQKQAAERLMYHLEMLRKDGMETIPVWCG